MTAIVPLIKDYGWPTVAVALLVWIVLRGEINFRYPR
jgi:hypothetical protein